MVKPESPALAGGFLTVESPGKPQEFYRHDYVNASCDGEMVLSYIVVMDKGPYKREGGQSESEREGGKMEAKVRVMQAHGPRNADGLWS